MRRALTVWMVIMSSNAQASDKGLKAELAASLVPLVCETTIAADLAPIVERRRRLAIAKMSQEGLAHEHAAMDAAWREIAHVHARALQEMAPSPRTLHLASDDAFLEQTVTAALPQIRRRCPKLARTLDKDAVFELLQRRLKDPPAPSSPSTPSPPTGP